MDSPAADSLVVMVTKDEKLAWQLCRAAKAELVCRFVQIVSLESAYAQGYFSEALCVFIPVDTPRLQQHIQVMRENGCKSQVIFLYNNDQYDQAQDLAQQLPNAAIQRMDSLGGLSKVISRPGT